MIDTGLKGKVVLITGANNPLGIGAATASAFAREGAHVFITYLRLSPEASGLNPSEVSQATETGLAFYHSLRTKTADEAIQSISAEVGQDDHFILLVMMPQDQKTPAHGRADLLDGVQVGGLGAAKFVVRQPVLARLISWSTMPPTMKTPIPFSPSPPAVSTRLLQSIHARLCC